MTVDNVQERTGVVTFKGQPMTLLGPGSCARAIRRPSFR